MVAKSHQPAQLVWDIHNELYIYSERETFELTQSLIKKKKMHIYKSHNIKSVQIPWYIYFIHMHTHKKKGASQFLGFTKWHLNLWRFVVLQHLWEGK